MKHLCLTKILEMIFQAGYNEQNLKTVTERKTGTLELLIYEYAF